MMFSGRLVTVSRGGSMAILWWATAPKSTTCTVDFFASCPSSSAMRLRRSSWNKSCFSSLGTSNIQLILGILTKMTTESTKAKGHHGEAIRGHPWTQLFKCRILRIYVPGIVPHLVIWIIPWLVYWTLIIYNPSNMDHKKANIGWNMVSYITRFIIQC